jgi:hypothetical protein
VRFDGYGPLPPSSSDWPGRRLPKEPFMHPHHLSLWPVLGCRECMRTYNERMARRREMDVKTATETERRGE